MWNYQSAYLRHIQQQTCISSPGASYNNKKLYSKRDWKEKRQIKRDRKYIL